MAEQNRNTTNRYLDSVLKPLDSEKRKKVNDIFFKLFEKSNLKQRQQLNKTMLLSNVANIRIISALVSEITKKATKKI